MAKDTKKLPYEPPQALDLSASAARGDTSPLGTCASGGKPYTACTIGDGPQGGGCLAGSLVDQQPQCTQGSMASVTCWPGGDAG